MANINTSEDDFQTIASAALAAQDAGETELAQKLDKIARKINAALTARTARPYAWISGSDRKPPSWQDMPSVLEGFESLKKPKPPPMQTIIKGD